MGEKVGKLHIELPEPVEKANNSVQTEAEILDLFDESDEKALNRPRSKTHNVQKSAAE